MSRAVAVAVLGALLLLVGLAGEARADEVWQQEMLDRQSGLRTDKRIRARLAPTAGTRRGGGQGWIRVELINPTEKARSVDMTLMSQWGDEDRCAWRRRVALPPQQRVELDLPYPSVNDDLWVQFALDGRASPRMTRLDAGIDHDDHVALVLAPPGTTATGLITPSLQALAKRASPVRDFHLQVRTPAVLPSSWTLLSGFDVVIVRGGLALTEEQQDLLLQYVAGGGSLACVPSGTGPLAGLVAEEAGAELVSWPDAAARHGRYGLGRWLALDSGELFLESEALWTWMGRQTAEGAGVLSPRSRAHAGPVPDKLWLPLGIPGVGRAPTGLFFLLILGFALLVGPVSYIHFRRRHRLPMLLVTIPLLGFLCTALILGYGFLSEGFGTVGSARSFTVLDQTSHRAAAIRGSTLYAGLQPATLQPRPGSYVENAAFLPFDSYRGGTARLQVDLGAGGRMDGALLPSRTPTPFIAATVGTSRERLRFRRTEDGRFEILAAPGLRPASGADAVLFRSFDGAYHRSVGGDVLEPLPADAVKGVLARLLRPIDALPAGAGEWAERRGWWGRVHFETAASMQHRAERTMGFDVWIADRVHTLRPGSYVARVERGPLPEDLDLDVTYRAAEHVVYGLLAEEDVLDG